MTEKVSRSAVYTRKSSEEGLDQSFNSLHAQREACEAYVASQKHEGWQLLPGHYDDGGFSGGNMERPGLAKLLADIDAGKIDTVVVYKVDRLTRSLSDFARIVETFDRKSVSFVSVTQQFNTTSSMGRLTLNVLLSFAQFEREVTGERIRDKVAASKKKGMWMGGNIPLGYDLKDRALVVNESEAETVRKIFQKYLELRSVFDLHEALAKAGVRSKERVCLSGRQVGGRIISRGTLYNMLSNPLYVGKVRHRGSLYPGQHDAIIDDRSWTQTAELLKTNGIRRITSRNISSDRPLMGILFREDGTRFTPTHATKKGRRYDYYMSSAGKDVLRLPAAELESAVRATLRSLLSNGDVLSQHFKNLKVADLRVIVAAAQHRAEILAESSKAASVLMRSLLDRVVCGEDSVRVELSADRLYAELSGRVHAQQAEKRTIVLKFPLTLKRRGNAVRITLSNGTSESAPVLSLGRAISRAHDWTQRIIEGDLCTLRELIEYSKLSKRTVQQTFRLATLSPQNVLAVLNGVHPVEMTIASLAQVPVDWVEQRLV